MGDAVGGFVRGYVGLNVRRTVGTNDGIREGEKVGREDVGMAVGALDIV